MTNPHDGPDEDPDIVQVVLKRVGELVPGFSDTHAATIDQEVRTKYGGLRVRIPKRGKYLTPAQKEKAYQDALSTMPTQELLGKHKISRATLFRLMKKDPGRRG